MRLFISYSFAVLLLAGCAGAETDYLKGNIFEKKEQMEKMAANLKAECSDCHTAGKFWLTRDGRKAREMMRLSLTMGVECTYCHKTLDTFNGKGRYTKEKMITLVEDFRQQCDACHITAKKHNEKGEWAEAMLDNADDKKLKCTDCHIKGSTMNKTDLTERGIKAKAEKDFPIPKGKSASYHNAFHQADVAFADLLQKGH
jgi:nitrate/TMAO reductase-like tetraheme cytochrome c subunit